MAVTFQAVGTAVSATTGTLTVAWPAHQADDVALLWVTSSAGGTTQTLTTANGFTLITTATTGTGTAGTRLSLYWARATSSAMASPVITAGTDFKYGVITTYRGATAAGTPIAASAFSTKGTASTSVTLPAVTASPGTLIVLGVSSDVDSASAFLTSVTNANLSGITERFDAGTTDGLGGGIAVVDGTKTTTSGSTGTSAGVVVSSINAMQTVALIPAEAASTFPLTDTFTTDSSAKYHRGGDTSTLLYAAAALTFSRADVNEAQIFRDITGFTVGGQYTVSADFKSNLSAVTNDAWIAVENVGAGTHVSVVNAAASSVSYTFTATATSHRVQFFADATAGGNTGITFDNLSVVAAGVGSQDEIGTADLTGSGTLTTSGKPDVPRAATLTGSGTLTTAVTTATTGPATLNGAGTLTVSGGPSSTGAATLGGSGTLTASGKPNPARATTLTGTGTLTAVGVALAGGSSTPALNGAGTLTTTRTVRTATAPNLTGSGTLNSSATVFTNDFLGFANLNGTGALTTTATPTVTRAVPLTGSGTLGALPVLATSSGVQFVGAGTLTAVLSPALARIVQLTGNGALTAVGVAVVPRNITATGILLARRWDAELTPRDNHGALIERDNTGTLLERTNTGTLTPRRWEAEL